MPLQRNACVLLLSIIFGFGVLHRAHADVAGKPNEPELVIAAEGHTAATVVVAPNAGDWEKRAAADLVFYIEKMTGARPRLADKPETVAAATQAAGPLLIVGRAALDAEPSLRAALAKVAKPKPVLRADAIVVRRQGNRVYLAGTNDDSHYYAVADLLRRWGCRWYVPGEFGECIPHQVKLTVGDLDAAYAPPFEVRRYWLSWDGDTTGSAEFKHRNFFNEVSVPSGHALGQYTKELIPPGKTMFNVPISEDRTAEHVAKQVLAQFKEGKDVMLGMEDGLYESSSPQDKQLVSLQYDKYFLTQSYTDAFMVLYNKLAAILAKQAPDSRAKIGFLIYSNITLPPVRDVIAAKPLVAYLAPIDFDPIHGMDDPRSAPRREYRDILFKWAKVMQGRLVIYDYDQNMLVWRDIPDPSQQAFRVDVKEYRKAGVLGIDTESRGATATTFLNLFLRGQLQWNPDADVDGLLAEFYPKFYGPAAAPMAEYWTAIYRAWENTIATEHEYFVAPAIYTPELLDKLRTSLAAAETAVKLLETAGAGSDGKRFFERVRFTRLSFEVLDAYMAMVHSAATDADYKAAVAAGERGLAARERLTAMNGTFTTYKVIGENGYAWWPGEVQQYRELLPFTDGPKGRLIARLPLEWNFRRDPTDVGVKENWVNQKTDLGWWNGLKQPVTVADRQQNPGTWERVRTDLYLQAQGIVTKDFQSYTGHGWYQTDMPLDAAQVAGKVHLRFPGMFNECWLYVNGQQIAHREFKGVWWMNDYRFEWDVDLSGKLKPGENSFVLRINNPHHLGGMFRRPFLYEVVASAAVPASPPRVELTRDGRAILSITIGAGASAATKATAAELAAYLGRISEAEFKIAIGDGSGGIVVGQPAEFLKLPFTVSFGTGTLEREDYVLRSTAGGLYLLGATDMAVEHAAWDLLDRMGYRQFFPGATWEIVPSTPRLAIAVDCRESPSFNVRRIWYDWGLWGYNDDAYHAWCRRNRMANGFDLQSGHAYESIIAANAAEFARHPEYYALVNGERKPRGDVKLCIGNPGLRRLVVDYAVRYFKQNPRADSISMEPSDGGGWCECDECKKLGSPSDRALTLANDVADAINRLGLGPRYVGMYAYNQHAAPPHIQVHPNVIVSATTAFITGGLTFDQVVEGWRARGATLGVYDYLSVVDWDWNLPRGGAGSKPSRVAEFLPKIYRQGARFYDAESGDCWGPCGLGYYVTSRVLWDVKQAEHVDAIVDDFLDKAFGSAKEPMREFYRLISEDTQRRPPSDMIGRMYRQLDRARHATADGKILARIDDLTLYTHYAELYYAYANGSGSVDDVARFAYRIRKTMMVHSYGLWCRLLSQRAALTANHPLKDDRPFAAAEIAKILADGIAKNQPSEPGFTSREFSKTLVPAAGPLRLAKVPLGRFPTNPQDHQRYFIWVPKDAAAVNLKITVQKVWALRPPKISLFSPQDVKLDAVSGFDAYKPDGKTYDVRLPTPYVGLHRVELVDGGDYSRVEWPAAMPVTIESGIDTSEVTSHFRGPWSLYFYVPKGTKLVGGWASRIANWAPRISGKLRDADGHEILDFAKLEEGWFKTPVAAGEDGRLWKFEDSQGQRLLMTVPPYLARSAEELLLPAEVVKADAKP